MSRKSLEIERSFSSLGNSCQGVEKSGFSGFNWQLLRLRV